MIEKMYVKKYKKLNEITVAMSPRLNIISGTNGTCKTSLLHMISNSYRAINKTDKCIQEPACLDVIKQINNSINPKIEALTKGDKTYNDPAIGHKGTLFTVDYFGGSSLDFRKHNSNTTHRYSIKPAYGKGKGDKLPPLLVIYLGLARLYPFGEYFDNKAITRLKRKLPNLYEGEILEIYKSLTGMIVTSSRPEKMGNIKVRSDFNTNKAGIDSNTVSSGEENLFIIITALVSLKYYFESITSVNKVESILLIDELDATIHPSLQFRLLDILREFSTNYKIQVVFTTHSLSLLEYALDAKKDRVIYLIDNITDVIEMEEPDIFKIKMHLFGQSQTDMYKNKKIPVVTEDEEARIFLKLLFDRLEKKFVEFQEVRPLFHIVNSKVGAQSLNSLFDDPYFLKTSMKFICILDGDQTGDFKKNTIILPGLKSPEEMIMEYANELYERNDRFWTLQTTLDVNHSKTYYRDTVKPAIDNIGLTLEQLAAAGESAHGKKRILNQKVFNEHQAFFLDCFSYWLIDEENQIHIEKFYKDLNIAFKKMARFHGINPRLWNVE